MPPRHVSILDIFDGAAHFYLIFLKNYGIIIIENEKRGFKMIKITEVKITTPSDYYEYHVFEKYIAENNKALCLVDNEIVTADEGNTFYRELISRATKVKKKVHEIKADNAKIIERFQNSIDPYPQYIDDWKTYERTIKFNELMYKLIDTFKTIAE